MVFVICLIVVCLLAFYSDPYWD